MGTYTCYTHHNLPVWVREDLQGKHRQFCLCYDCAMYKPDTEENCPIAQSLFMTDVEFSIVTPVWECPEFKVKS
jgi:hypothetical protein